MPAVARRWVDALALPERASVLGWLWDAQPEGVIVLGAGGRVLDANRAAAAMLGVTREALVGKLPDDPVWRRIRLPDGTPVAPGELPGGPRGPEGPTVYAIRVPGRAAALVRAEAARTELHGGLSLVTLVEVTGELEAGGKAEPDTADADELLRFRALVEASGSCIALLDTDWCISYMNGAGLAMTGLDAGSAPGTPYLDVLAEEAHAEHLEVERPAVAREGRWAGDSILQPRRGGRPVHVHAMTDLIRDKESGEPLGIVAIRRDVGRERRLRLEHDAIANVAMTVASGAERDAIFAAASREAARMLDAAAAAVVTPGRAGGEVLGAWHTSPREEALLQRAVAALAAAATRGTTEPRDVPVGDDEHALAAPVLVEGATWGRLVVCCRGTAFDPEDGRALQRLAGQIGSAVGVAAARDVLVRQATTDGLTGLLNHRAFHDALRGEVRRARRYGRPLSVVLVDLDEFKQVNDRHGHQAGDRLLCRVASVLHDVVRGSEIVARLGGDEFALLLPETDLLGARASAERVRAAVATLPEAASQGVSASAGVADLAQAGTADDLIRLADGALYWSKVHGRNRVSAYDPERVEALSAQERVDRLTRTHALGAVRVLARLIDLKDPSTHEHSERVAHLAVVLARELGWAEERQARLRDAALVHDVGKVVIPDTILNKPAPLTPEEFAIVTEHPLTGARIAAEALDAEQARWIAEHHERPDGTGYPLGRKDGEISDGGHILAFADGWDVMTSDRPYKSATPPVDALRECQSLSGRQFDGEVLAAFERRWMPGAVKPMI
jgi:diguanylate cyclase (GGDEF)-like protein/PAS domain S-box-containing protein/putative nucleotidyltransferase with HDIG domain